MNKLCFISLLCMVVFLWSAAGATADDPTAGSGFHKSSRETLSLDQGWRFHLGDIPQNSFPGGQGIALYGPDLTYNDAKAGHTWGAAARGYDDTSWRQVDLPHDWVVEQPFDQNAFKQQGYRPRGIAWYRKTFKLDPSDYGRNIELQFDGVATHCTVYFNGTPVHHNFCGYTSFYIDVTPMVRYGDDINTIAVRVDAETMEGWWYEGGGIYRHTWLVKRSPVHVVTDGVYANPVKGADGTWTIPAEVTLTNTGSDAASASVAIGVFDSAGKQVADGRSAPVSIIPLGEAVAKISIPVASPKLWSVDQPNLYTVQTSVLSDNKPVDAVDTTCGFRTIRFDAKEGFFLNDQPLKLQGTCNHQDHAGVGVAVPDSIQEFRIRKLKEMGSNAYRTAHNPPSKELLDICDRLGMLVMDETRHFNASPEYLKQLEWLVRRDRNHPSVILWSLFNEEALEINAEGMEMTRYMSACVKRLDATRPTTGAQNKGQLGPDGKLNPKNAALTMDVVGINYQAYDYDKILAAYPDKPIVSTEDTSQVMTRGEYATDHSRNIVGSYDDVFPGWDTYSGARNSWKAIATRPRIAGGFSWTGFDYRGEPTPYGWPSAGSYFGAMDLCGFPKTEFYIRQAMWVHDKPVLTLVPHWNWAGKEGQPIKVMALANCDTVELLLNGKSLGEKPVDPFEMVSWEVPYAPGKLEAIGKTDSKQVSHFTVETTGETVALRLTPDRTSLAGDGCDALPVTVEAIDTEGRPVPTANLPVEFEITGPGAIIGVGNGDPTSHEPEVFIPRITVRAVALDEWHWKQMKLPTESKASSPEYALNYDDSHWNTIRGNSTDMPLKDGQTAIYRARFMLTEEDLTDSAVRIAFAGCDDHGVYFVNNRFVGETHDWQAKPQFDVKDIVHAGENIIAVAVKNDGGPGGLNPAVKVELVNTSTSPWSRRLFNGLAQVILQSRKGGSGNVVLRAGADGLKPAEAAIRIEPVPSGVSIHQ